MTSHLLASLLHCRAVLGDNDIAAKIKYDRRFPILGTNLQPLLTPQGGAPRTGLLNEGYHLHMGSALEPTC
ncbi:hypothetical protein B0T09DRAFT_332184 [Sordaria sp. MPI-SDFR-AT-0083]|nr:hypothetical protein B0T09DRAFT_332184 [Sordaria sp. MPI-SDFR-AT-0083]